MSSGENERLAGRYRVVRQLGRGGMGVVWRAVDEVLGREVAVKELRTYNDSSGPELADLHLRMQREARAAARVRHPGVIAVHDVTEHQGRPVIVMELIDGPSLDDMLSEHGVLDPREAARIGAAVLEALAAAHDVGVLHRDVKPGNVLLDRGGRVVLTDFGIATMDDPGDGSTTHLTRSGEIVGSLDYLAPERAQGHQPGPASDVWALGATLYAAVEGSSPFRRTSTWSTLNAIVVEPLPEPRRSGALGPVLQQLLQKDPTQRPDARTAARLLSAVAQDAPPPHLHAPTEPNAAPHHPEGFGPATAHGPGAFGPGGAGHAAGSGVAGGERPAEGFGPAEPHGPGAFGPGDADHAAGPGVAGGERPAEGFGPAEPHGPGAFGPGGTAHAGHADSSGGPGGDRPAGAFGPAGAPGADGYRSPAAASMSSPYGPPAGHGHPASSTPAPTAPQAPRKTRSTALVAAAVAAVLLAGGGVTYALVDRDRDRGVEQERLADGPTPTTPGTSPGRVLDPGDPAATASATATGSASASATPSKTGTTKPASPTPSTASKAPVPGTGGGGTTGGGTSGGTTTTGGGGSTSGGSTTTTGGGSPAEPEPVCHSIGGGKYNCQVWRTEKTYSHSGAEMGILNAGTNYFYCQVNLGRRVTYGQWTNVWWARTDDDSGNTNVYFSVVYIQGGDNDQPVPGLPVC
ncbi:serine/threonine-protein kinase [Streptomyces vilmorinianum]|uniref:serine/threonine-protein kinase n=1 Tax=Streptomyces vilmorinianum TaxID=3051092 RepID=UPI0010FB8BDC|nr:serine/threonine-protein kinase [Streptomyces vilmorinianum]